MTIRPFYELSLIFISLLALPKTLYMLIVHKKYRRSLLKRLGAGFPAIKKDGRLFVWIHAVSLGETKAIAPLIKRIQAELDNPLIVISNGTETGHAEALRTLPSANHHVYLPFDFGWLIRPIIAKASPDIVILSESDFWYNFLSASKQHGAKIIVANGKISEKSKRRFLKTPRFTHALFNLIDLICVQSRHYRERFEQLHIPAEKLVTTGNMKFDDTYPKLNDEQLNNWKQQLGIQPDDQILVFGSSHDPEEKMILGVLQQLWLKYPKLKLLLVPRHPERFKEVGALIQHQNIPYQSFTQIKGDTGNPSSKVILIDAMGLLRKCYQLAHVACVGGSWTAKIGGHNILEPSWYGVPVLYGPHMFGQPELVQLAEEYGSGEKVSSIALGERLEALLQNPAKRMAAGSAGLKLVTDMNGATNKTWEALKEAL